MKIHMDFDLDPNILAERVDAADKWLTDEVASNSSNFVPFRQGTLRGKVETGEDAQGHYITWNTPYAQYMYEGYVYVNPKYNRAGWQDEYGEWHGYKGTKVKTERHLQYSTPGTGDHWDEKAAAVYMQHWQDGYAKILGD